MNQKLLPHFISCFFLVCGSTDAQQPARIVVDAGQVQHRLSRYLTGACLEDVNHEIYGGLYSQMIFGESFQEPPPPLPLKGFVAYGGRWLAKDGALLADAGDGPKLVSEELAPQDGEVGVEVLLPERKNGNAGLILRVSEPGIGADRFAGYEIALDSTGHLVLGRHRQNWEPLRNVPCEVPVNEWLRLVVRFAGNSLEVLVNDKSALTFKDEEHALTGGRLGLRTWQREARFRSLYVQTARGRRSISFEQASDDTCAGVSGMWRSFRRGSARGEGTLDTRAPFVGSQSQRLTFSAGQGEVGLENRSLNRWGMNFVKGRPYEGYVCVRAEQPAELCLAMESADGARTYSEERIRVAGPDWQRLAFKLKPNADDSAGRFAIKLQRPGSVCIGHAFLQPGEWGRFKGLPVRKDVTEALIAQGLTVLRYGGSMVNHAEYRWKKMIGPREQRAPYHGTWYAQSSNGWGIFDFLSFCEAAGFLGIPAVNMDESPADMADFVEYANGAPGSEWGRRRAADGHRAPYHIKYVELGNEEAVNEGYWRKFKPLAEAMWARDANLILVVGDFAYDRAITDPNNFTGAPLIKTLATHKKILDLARAQGREVWFDVHIGTERPPDPRGLPGVRSFIEQLARLSPGAKYKVAVFEFNANNHALKRALANASAINQLQRLGEPIAVACSANCLQPYKQNDNGWNQGLLFLSPSQVWPQPPYFVTQMVSQNYLPLGVKCETQSPNDVLDVAATRSEGGGTLVLQVVNIGSSPLATAIEFKGFQPHKPTAQMTVLSGDLEAISTPEEPNRVKPVQSSWRHEGKDGVSTCTFPPRSFTVLRFE